MKGFLIFMVILVGGSIYLLTHTTDLALQALAEVEKQEGPMDTMTIYAARQDPAPFIAKYQPFLERRAMIAKWIPIFGDEQVMFDLVTATRARYENSPLGNSAVYASMIFQEAVAYDDRGNPGPAAAAFELYHYYLNQFPDGKDTVDVNNALSRLATKYNLK